jgi:hypothetical protein
MLLALSSNGFGGSGSSGDTVQRVWTAYTEAQRQFQRELADFLISRRPDLKDLIVLSRDLQLALIERRSLEFRSLLATHPERIVRSQGISKLANFDWTDEDAALLRRSKAEYDKATERVRALRDQSDGHAQWPTLRDAIKTFATEAEYQMVFQRFDERVEAAGKLLERRR